MLTTEELNEIYDYGNVNDTFSLENSPMEDYLENTSEEDFLQQLSSDLDIPLLLNPSDDELGMLNSFLDRSPEEILSEIVSPVPSSKPQDISSEITDFQQLDLSFWGPEAYPNLTADSKKKDEQSLTYNLNKECNDYDVVENEHIITSGTGFVINKKNISEGRRTSIEKGSPLKNEEKSSVNDKDTNLRNICGNLSNKKINPLITERNTSENVCNSKKCLSLFTGENMGLLNSKSNSLLTNKNNFLVTDENVLITEINPKENQHLSSVKSNSPTPSNSSDSSRSSKEEFLLDTPPISPNNATYTLPVIKNINETNKQIKIHQKNILKPKAQSVKRQNDLQNVQPKKIQKKSEAEKKSQTSGSPSHVILSSGIINGGHNVVLLDNLPQITPINGSKVTNPLSQIAPLNGGQIANPLNGTQITTVTNVNALSTCLPVSTGPIFIKNEPIFIKQEPVLSIRSNVDPKFIKRQQRMIKNRESANLSRKKKKEYLNSLEKQVQDLQKENKQLKLENADLKQQLAAQKSINNPQLKNFIPNKSFTKTIAICMFVFFIGFNLDLSQTPLNFKSAIRNIESNEIPQISEFHTRSLLWANQTDSEPFPNNTDNVVPLPTCPMYINQSESVRLALELHKWIGKPYNITLDLYQQDNLKSAKSKLRKLKQKQKKRLSNQVEKTLFPTVYKFGKESKVPEEIGSNELQIFLPKAQRLYAEFFEAINRKDDTFYVVSFSANHLLLPALHHNKTRRPKMSLIMPSMLPNESFSTQRKTIPLMQIDCEVVDTRLIHVNYGSIPQHMRNQSYSSYEDEQEKNKHENKHEGVKRNKQKMYRPYFIKRKKYQNPGNSSFNLNEGEI